MCGASARKSYCSLAPALHTQARPRAPQCERSSSSPSPRCLTWSSSARCCNHCTGAHARARAARARRLGASRRDLRLGHRVRVCSLNFARERSQADNSTVLAGGDGGVRALPRVRRLWLHSRPSTAPDGRGRAVTELPSAGVCGVGAGGDRRGQADGGGRHRRRHPLQARPHPRERRAVTPAPQPPPRDAACRAGRCAPFGEICKFHRSMSALMANRRPASAGFVNLKTD